MTSSLAQFSSLPVASAPAQRYADGLARLHGRLRYPDLIDAIDGDALVRLDGLGDGLTTVAVRTGQLPERYLRALYGFRLTQFLQIGFMDADLAYARRLAHEPIPQEQEPESIHVCTVDARGRIVGYACLARSPDAVPLALDDPGREPFPVEEAHEVDVLAAFAAPARTTHAVYEIKRLVRAKGLERGMQRARVPWHLIVALCQVGLRLGPEIQVIVGDSGERSALRHLGLLGFDLQITEGTRPRVGRDQLMWPSYELPDETRAKPFAAEVRAEPLAAHAGVVERSLREYQGDDWQQYTVGQLAALIERRQAQETGGAR